MTIASFKDMVNANDDMFLMRTWEHDYLQVLDTILTYGESRADRTGTGTLAIFGDEIRVDLQQGFPAVTTKKLMWKAVLSELLWFIEGSGDERRLREILHGTRDSDKKTIWTANAENTASSKFSPNFPGDLGRIYGVQWRHWRSTEITGYDSVRHFGETGAETFFNAKVLVQEVDQLKSIIHTLKTNPTDRRMVLSAWNPGELHQMALPPCHMFAQFYLSNTRELSCQMYMRSADAFLGIPFNVASYALLTHMIAHVIKADVGDLRIVIGDTHIYNNHIDQVNELLSRDVRTPPKLVIKREVNDIDDFQMDDFELVDYDPHPAIFAEMSV
jgi:thymidylate synthase